METKKRTIILSVIALTTLALLVVGATFAYFQSQYGSASNADVNVTTYTTDVLTFATGDDINIYADQSTFASGKGNATGSTFARATLTANNKTNTATEHYYVYLNISNNSFTYSINESTPELILTVTDSAGTEVTDISGLTHASVTDGSGTTISGYDITNKSGLITLFNNREITASPSKEETWNIKLTFVNYDENQNANAGKSMSAKVMIQKEKIVQTMANVCKNGQTLSSCVIAMDGIDETLYHHTSTLANGAGDNSYRYAGASEAVNNFVCFGSNENSCPTDNLYRIIGVFGDQVKLIKYDYANSNLLGTDGDYSTDTYSKSSTYKGELTTINTYYWNKTSNTSSNTWSTSLFNKTNLNTNYLNNIGTTWSNMIENTTWKVSGPNVSDVTPKAMYTAEITNATKTYGPENGTSKIGLMYVSDYMYAASPTYWTYPGYSSSGATSDYRAATTSNWMYMGLLEWTISRYAGNSVTAFYVDVSGFVSSNILSGVVLALGVRPVFSLTSSVNYASGSGTAADPILVN